MKIKIIITKESERRKNTLPGFWPINLFSWRSTQISLNSSENNNSKFIKLNNTNRNRLERDHKIITISTNWRWKSEEPMGKETPYWMILQRTSMHLRDIDVICLLKPCNNTAKKIQIERKQIKTAFRKWARYIFCSNFHFNKKKNKEQLRKNYALEIENNSLCHSVASKKK